MNKPLSQICYFILLTVLPCISHCQDFKRQPANKRNDTSLAIYSWEWHNQFHSAYSEINLLRSGRYIYYSRRPFADNEFSEGLYQIKKDTLILNSDLQVNKTPVKIEYVDTTSIDSSYKKLSFPVNILAKVIYEGFYFVNNDSAIRSMYDPLLPFNQNLLDSVYSLKVQFNYNTCSSAWIPILKNNKFIKVTVLTDKDLDEYKNKSLTNAKFKLTKKVLIDIFKNL